MKEMYELKRMDLTELLVYAKKQSIHLFSNNEDKIRETIYLEEKKSFEESNTRAQFFQKQVRLLRKHYGEEIMYDSELLTKSETTIVTNCWMSPNIVERVLIDLKNEKVFVLDRFNESESEFMKRLVG